MRRATMETALAALLSLTTVGSAAAQTPVIKPTTGTTLQRLGSPGPVVAQQQSDGSILVRWRALPGAAKYQVTRSVPPAASQVVATVPDTSYTDTNVQVGSSYYYVVGAFDSSGVISLKAGSQPVTATATAAPSLVAGGTTGSTGGGTSGAATPTATLAAPLKVDAIDQETYPFNVVFFGFKQGGLTYRVERSLYASAQKGVQSWQLRQTTGPLPCCTWSILDTLTGITGAVMYRVTAVDPANPSITSPPTMSGWINSTPPLSRPTATGFNLPQTSEVSRTDRVGAMIPLVPRGMILDQNGVLALDSRGLLIATAPGVAHYLWGSLWPSGAPIVQVVRITVIP